MKKYHVPAMSVCLMDADNIMLSEIQGLRIANTGAPATLHDYFHIGSASKSVLAVIAGRLIEQGKLNWHTKLFDLMPELKSESSLAYDNIMLEDLFLCTAGIRPFTAWEEQFPDIDATNKNRRLQFVPWLLQQPPSSTKTADGRYRHLYSNAGYTIAAAMLEKVSGKSYEALVREMLTTASGLQVIFGLPNHYGIDQPWGHGSFYFDENGAEHSLKKEIRAFEPGSMYKLNELILPAGDLSMTPVDFAKYVQGHLKGLRGISNYLAADTYQYIHFAHKGFSLGVANTVIHKKVITGFDGSLGTFYCRAIIIPKDNLAFTIMINSGSKKAVDRITFRILKKYYNWGWKL